MTMSNQNGYLSEPTRIEKMIIIQTSPETVDSSYYLLF